MQLGDPRSESNRHDKVDLQGCTAALSELVELRHEARMTFVSVARRQLVESLIPFCRRIHNSWTAAVTQQNGDPLVAAPKPSVCLTKRPVIA